MQRTLKNLFETKPLSLRPIDMAEFVAFMEPLVTGHNIERCAVAVSGGPDSMALAVCMQKWASSRSIALKAFIVDHGLRSESAIEAETVKTHLADLDIDALILRWQHPDITSHIHSSARKARYRLLNEACRQNNIRHLFFAHHREDQAETILMRFAKGTGIDGLAGIPSSAEKDGIYIFRPFLGTAKDRLIATCDASQLAYVTDPSNASEKYARGRLRKVLPLLDKEGLSIERLNDLGARASEAKAALDHYTTLFLRNSTQRDAAGAISMDWQVFAALPYAIAERALGAALENIHHDDYAPERASMTMLVKDAQAEAPMPNRTLQGCLIGKTETKITIMREYGCIIDSPLIMSEETILWDGRWKISIPFHMVGQNISIKALGNPEHTLVDKLAPGLRHLIPQGRIRAGMPALWRDDSLIEIPSFVAVDNSKNINAVLVKSWPEKVI